MIPDADVRMSKRHNYSSSSYLRPSYSYRPTCTSCVNENSVSGMIDEGGWVSSPAHTMAPCDPHTSRKNNHCQVESKKIRVVCHALARLNRVVLQNSETTRHYTFRGWRGSIDVKHRVVDPIVYRIEFHPMKRTFLGLYSPGYKQAPPETIAVGD